MNGSMNNQGDGTGSLSAETKQKGMSLVNKGVLTLQNMLEEVVQ